VNPRTKILLDEIRELDETLSTRVRSLMDSIKKMPPEEAMEVEAKYQEILAARKERFDEWIRVDMAKGIYPVEVHTGAEAPSPGCAGFLDAVRNKIDEAVREKLSRKDVSKAADALQALRNKSIW
jgi:hypothetical protein